jgi:hypothetical protein
LRFKLLIMLVWIAGICGSSFADEAQIPDVIVSYGSENSKEYVIAVEKESQQLFVYSCAGTCTQVLRFACSTGRSQGAKAVQGDNKTPEGIYFFVNIHEQKDLAPIYGIRAFVTDYPNSTDRSNSRTGSEIWLHGTNKVLKDRDSSGCVVMENENIQTISQYITLNRTPMIIVEKLSYSPDPAVSESLRKLVAGWTQALQSGSYHKYLQFYDDEYLPDMSWWLKWNKARKDAVSLESGRLGIFKYGDKYMAITEQSVKSAEKQTTIGMRKLFIAKKAEEFRIIGDEYQGIASYTEHPLLAAARMVKTVPVAASSEPLSATDQDGIGQMLDQWLSAWSSKDIGQYSEFYASDFHSQGMDKTAWLKYKENLNRKYRYIRVSKRDVTIRKDNSHIIVSFMQSY